ncbi:MAG: exodeoxyribonuclease VII large subunit [Anaerolineaceae bacterium]|nr:exodeoxyribonuclease VII large subunit [Anaerolineaceae bacterium]
MTGLQPGLFSSISLSVTDLTGYIRRLLESDEMLGDIWVEGEISNLSRPASGHIYFTLKDQKASLKCVVWRSNAARLRFAIQNGMAIEAHGHISLYEPSGQYQLYVDGMRPAGEGRLYQEFMRLKSLLEEEGLFDQSLKRDFPFPPRSIGIVTSSTAAALQDMLNTIQNRYPLAEVILSPTLVQGEDAPPEIVAAIARLNQIKPDVILVARGGGSLEDLWAFNDERVVRAVAESDVPVITGIGHETDFTLADFAADLRAPTPTGAAMLATPERSEIEAQLSGMGAALDHYFKNSLVHRQNQLMEQGLRLKQVSPDWHIQNSQQRLDDLDLRLRRAYQQLVFVRGMEVENLFNKLTALNPEAILKRGFAIVRDATGGIVRSISDIQQGKILDVQLKDGHFSAAVDNVSIDD